MGQYIQAGICYQIGASKKDMNRSDVKIDDVKKELGKELSLDLYESGENESEYFFSLKPEIIEKNDLSEFLSEQYKLLNVDKKYSDGIISRLKETGSAEDIINLAEQKEFANFQDSGTRGLIECGWNRIAVGYCTIIFMLEGKILMEAYNDFLLYVERLIRKSSKHRISGAVKVFIE